jgi:hypothetical protein
VVFGLLPRLYPLLSRLGIVTLIILGSVGWQGWLIWAILLILVGYNHPAPIWYEPTLLARTRGIGILALLIFALTFMPTPFVM